MHVWAYWWTCDPDGHLVSDSRWSLLVTEVPQDSTLLRASDRKQWPLAAMTWLNSRDTALAFRCLNFSCSHLITLVGYIQQSYFLSLKVWVVLKRNTTLELRVCVCVCVCACVRTCVCACVRACVPVCVCGGGGGGGGGGRRGFNGRKLCSTLHFFSFSFFVWCVTYFQTNFLFHLLCPPISHPLPYTLYTTHPQIVGFCLPPPGKESAIVACNITVQNLRGSQQDKDCVDWSSTETIPSVWLSATFKLGWQIRVAKSWPTLKEKKRKKEKKMKLVSGRGGWVGGSGTYIKTYIIFVGIFVSRPLMYSGQRKN